MSDENGTAPPQPAFPRQEVQVMLQGVQTRKDIADQMRVIEHVKQSKNN